AGGTGRGARAGHRGGGPQADRGRPTRCPTARPPPPGGLPASAGSAGGGAEAALGDPRRLAVRAGATPATCGPLRGPALDRFLNTGAATGPRRAVRDGAAPSLVHGAPGVPPALAAESPPHPAHAEPASTEVRTRAGDARGGWEGATARGHRSVGG